MSDEKKPRVVAIIQARMGSTRLPGKVMMDIAGKPMLRRVIERVQRAKTVDAVTVAVPCAAADHPELQPMCSLVVGTGAAWFVPENAAENDVLGRYAEAAAYAEAHIIVRITADCPLIDPDVIDQVVGEFLDKRPDYASNTIERTYPRGLDVEVFSRAALDRAAEYARAPDDREHVTPYIRNPVNEFSHVSVIGGNTNDTVNWSVNTQEDLDCVRRIYEGLDGKEDFTWQEAGVHDFCSGVPDAAEVKRLAQIAAPEHIYRKVAIIGTAPSSRDLAPYQDKTWEIRSLSNRVVTDSLPRWDKHFELHPLSQFETDPQARPYVAWMHQQDDSKPIYLQSPEKYPGIVAGVSFPFEQMVANHGRYFTSTIAWMIALAIHEGVDEIGLWGIDLMLEDEYAHQRPCVEFLLGFATARGIKLTIPPQSSLMKPQQLYAVEGTGTPRAALDEHQKRLKGMVQQFQGERDQSALKMAHAQGAVEGLEFAKQMT